MNIFHNLGIDPMKFILQFAIWFLILGIPAVIASKRIISAKSGAAVPLWLLFIWFVPLFGAVVTLLHVKTPTNTKSLSERST